MDRLRQDLRYAVRSLRRTPGFTFTVVAVMALGIGVNSMIYTVVRGILFADLPYAEPERMVAIESLNRREGDLFEMSPPDLRDLAASSLSMRGISGWTESSLFVDMGDETQRFQATIASDRLTEALGVQPRLGRWFTPDECREGPHLGSVVLGDRAWREHFGADPNVLGRTARMNGRVRTVVGVMPMGFRFPESSDYFVPLAMNDSSDSRAAHYLHAVARLAPGASMAQARAETDQFATALEKAYPNTNKHMGLILTEYQKTLVKNIGPVMLMLTIAVIFVLLIACANVSNLMLARASVRRREIGVRLALGATRGRLVRQMLTESLLLACMGGALGVLLGEGGMRLTLAAIPVPLPYWMQFELDARVLASVAGASLLAGVAFGLAPALQASSGDVLTPLREGTPGGGDTPRSQRVRSTLVVAEIAMAVVLLIGAGLVVRSFLGQMGQRSGLQAEHVLTGTVTLPAALYPSDTTRIAFFREFRASLAALPGVRSVGGVLNLHLGASQWIQSVEREAMDAEDGRKTDHPVVGINVITPGYLEAVGLKLVRGRDLTDADVQGGHRVALVSLAAADRLWPRQDPIGKRWRAVPKDEKGWATVVGVVANVRQYIQANEADRGELLVPHAQSDQEALHWALRTDGEPAPLAAMARRALHQRDQNLAFTDMRTLTEHVRVAAWEPLIFAQLMGVFSVAALLIAALGIYGVMAYTVAQRTREIGIRMALGAARNDVQRLIVGQAMRLTLFGAGIGLAIAYGLTRFMRGMLFEIRPDDPLTFVGVTLILALSSAAAASLPTARAVRVDPVVALRHE